MLSVRSAYSSTEMALVCMHEHLQKLEMRYIRSLEFLPQEIFFCSSKVHQCVLKVPALASALLYYNFTYSTSDGEREDKFLNVLNPIILLITL